MHYHSMRCWNETLEMLIVICIIIYLHVTHAREAWERQALACPFPGGKADGQLRGDVVGRLHLRLTQDTACQFQVWVPGHEAVRKSHPKSWHRDGVLPGHSVTAEAMRADHGPQRPWFPQGLQKIPRTPLLFSTPLSFSCPMPGVRA